METKTKTEELIRDGVKELIIREGEALPLREPKIVDITGTIQAPAEFLLKRKDNVKSDKSHVLFSYNNLFIKLVTNENDHYSTTVTGKLIINKELEKFGINSDCKKWTKTELKTFLKMNRSFFKDVDSNLKIVTNLEKFSVSVQAQIDDHKDNRGNSKSNVDIKVDSNLDLKFTLLMPIFIGQPASSFEVEICFEVRDNGISIWLESPELQQLIISTRETLINKNIEPFKEDFVVIEQ